eukprot:2230688-Pleurochrysis_carterae.AAC.1
MSQSAQPAPMQLPERALRIHSGRRRRRRCLSFFHAGAVSGARDGCLCLRGRVVGVIQVHLPRRCRTRLTDGSAPSAAPSAPPGRLVRPLPPEHRAARRVPLVLPLRKVCRARAAHRGMDARVPSRAEQDAPADEHVPANRIHTQRYHRRLITHSSPIAYKPQRRLRLRGHASSPSCRATTSQPSSPQLKEQTRTLPLAVYPPP